MKAEHKNTVIYSNQKTDFRAGYRYSNARLFDGKVRAGVTRVIVVGDWPAVVKAYTKAGIEVVKCDSAGNILDAGIAGIASASAVEQARQPRAPHVQPATAPTSAIDPDTVEIPENWQTLPWNAKRKIAAALSEGHIINSEQAEAAITAELARRPTKPAAPKPPAPEKPASPAVTKPPKPSPTVVAQGRTATAPSGVVFSDAFIAEQAKKG